MSGCYKTVGENQTHERTHLKRFIITSPLIRPPPRPHVYAHLPSFTQPCANHYSNCSKCTLHFSLAQANLFAIFTVSCVSVIDLWQCISRQLFRRSRFMVPIRWFLRFTSETEYVEIFFTAPAIFSTPKRGVLCSPKTCSWGLCKSPLPCFAAYEFVYVIGLHAVHFGNNWMKKIPRAAKIRQGSRPRSIWLSEELFEFNYLQIGQACSPVTY